MRGILSVEEICFVGSVSYEIRDTYESWMGFMAKTVWVVLEPQLKKGKAVRMKGVVCSPAGCVFEVNRFLGVEICSLWN